MCPASCSNEASLDLILEKQEADDELNFCLCVSYHVKAVFLCGAIHYADEQVIAELANWEG